MEGYDFFQIYGYLIQQVYYFGAFFNIDKYVTLKSFCYAYLTGVIENFGLLHSDKMICGTQ